MKAGDVVIRVLGEFNGMKIGDLATIEGIRKGIYGLGCVTLMEYECEHSKECLRLATKEEIKAAGFILKEQKIKISEPLIFN